MPITKFDLIKNGTYQFKALTCYSISMYETLCDWYTTTHTTRAQGRSKHSDRLGICTHTPKKTLQP